ncbi:helix-turn-helix domain-containing protein [Salmonella enterica]|nr:helix-turn-helix domain-containing protein [Salmonella enterica]EIJ5374603.1 helix-turn-helix domain-containing protein [Salmonella enterica]EKR8390735.1 helix-turn-helix domain-containing protein [Salmonella enterica]
MSVWPVRSALPIYCIRVYRAFVGNYLHELIVKLLANGTSRRQVALIYDVAITTLYKKFSASVIHNIG